MTLYIDNKYVRLISHKVRNFKQKKENLYQLSCPICGDSKTNTSKARGYVYAKGVNLFYACHNCGISTNLATLLKNVDPTLYTEYIFERYKTQNTSNTVVETHHILTSTPRFDKVDKKTFAFAEYCNHLSEEHYCVQYLKNRKIPKELYNLFLFASNYLNFVNEVVPDHGKEILEDSRLVIPFYDENNELIAISGRALENSNDKLRYITVRTDNSTEKLLYGLERLDFKKPVKIVEGPIDSLFLDNCIASGDGNLMLAAKRLIDLGVKKEDITLISDNEPRNREICKLTDKSIKEGYNVVIWPDNIVQKDINDMIKAGKKKNQLESIISNRTTNGIEAQLMFNFWKKV